MEAHAHKTCSGMLDDIVKRFLSNAKEGCALDIVQLSFNPTGIHHFETNGDACPPHEVFYIRLEGGNKPHIVQNRRTQFTSELMDGSHGLFY